MKLAPLLQPAFGTLCFACLARASLNAQATFSPIAVAALSFEHFLQPSILHSHVERPSSYRSTGPVKTGQTVQEFVKSEPCISIIKATPLLDRCTSASLQAPTPVPPDIRMRELSNSKLEAPLYRILSSSSALPSSYSSIKVWTAPPFRLVACMRHALILHTRIRIAYRQTIPVVAPCSPTLRHV